MLRELRNRSAAIKDLRSSLFDKQLALIDDPAKLKTALCTRRAGKSYGAGVYLTLECLANPGSTCLYIATTRESAKRIMYKDVLKVISRKHDLKLRFNHTSLEVTFPNGSVIYLLGLDSSPEEMDKAYGQKYRLVVIDESGAWKQDQEALVHEVLEPGCADYNGTILMLGMPTNHTRSYFFRITYKPGNVPGWACHEWSWKDNPHVRVNMKKQVDRMVAANWRVVETPRYIRMYEGRWVVDDGAKCYKFTDTLNRCRRLPEGHDFFYGLGLDLGFEDATAFVVSAYSPTDTTLYFVRVIKKAGLDITGVAEVLTSLKAQYDFRHWVVDGASKQAVQELRNRHGFPLEPADKLGKVDFIEMMNADFTTGRIKLLPEAEPLAEEYGQLIWDPKSKKKEEHPACENHGTDAALYNWRRCYHYLASTPKKVEEDMDDVMDRWWDQEAERMKGGPKEDFVKRDFGKEYGYH